MAYLLVGLGRRIDTISSAFFRFFQVFIFGSSVLFFTGI